MPSPQREAADGLSERLASSGRYPPELVQGNIYPVWNTKERTEVYIGNEICALVNVTPSELSVRAHRVGVHIGHFVDVRVKVRAASARFGAA